MGWPSNWQDRISGADCPACAAGRFEESADPPLARFFAGEVSDAYLVLGTLQPGWAVVLWQGRHVVEPTDLTPQEAAAFNAETLIAARAMQAHYRPLKLNFQTLGNEAPHLHTSVTMRYSDTEDIAPGEDILPGRFVPADGRPPARDERADIDALRRLARAGGR
ncbi:histidine triad (HIT) protein [Spongiactinospora rosea]|uniref:Histidine triad (HIT) protein n=1 Tax=Spongiactinospora rosea TaxID=2248750 RepID=A0A366LWY4_9ACTN|nr:HIT domain-containing protein [Spongiactinospora rosea]RBQ18277.1 histidine triad (HIT) protein [Spongiactinospora rosea]